MVLLSVMAEASVLEQPKGIAPVRPARSLEESRQRLSSLVQGEKLPPEVELEQGKEIEEDEDQALDQQDKDKIGSKAPPVAAQPTVSDDQQSDDDQGDALLTQEEEVKASKAGFNKAVRWLTTWLGRQRKKRGSGYISN